MKLELKHLAPYLPYGLKFYVFDDPSFEKKYLEMYTNGNSRVEITIENIYKVLKDGYKPILRNLSDLTKEIEVNGARFVPVEYGCNGMDIGLLQLSKSIRNGNFSQSLTVSRFPYFIVEKLFEWHFDVFGLIENGLAVDINTLS